MMIISGMMLGIIYDIYRVVASQIYFRRWLISSLDVVYWILSTLFVFRMLYLSNSGEVRFYVFLGLTLGIIFHYVYFSPLTIKIIILVIRWIKALIHFVKKLFSIFIIIPIKMIYRCILILLGIIMAISIFLCKFMLQLLYPIWRVLKWLLKPFKTNILKWFRPILKRFTRR
ncbi:spore cortex biosynthesis protein YabQ [Chengkuizengella sp. YPA3-1-1]|uniref:Spore cortex biosynthesis protein YabQ n=2 Tax=Chengkuizengella marina TaxID=2507566 RepID=A0A6N9Q7P0_9BACL|nr:spore cortex biosynthesis protein YabQ [Chengkuizengella marina]